MSKRFIGNTVRFGRTGPVRGPSIEQVQAQFAAFTLCPACNRYIPRREFAAHQTAAHPAAVAPALPEAAGPDLPNDAAANPPPNDVTAHAQTPPPSPVNRGNPRGRRP